MYLWDDVVYNFIYYYIHRGLDMIGVFVQSHRLEWNVRGLKSLCIVCIFQSYVFASLVNFRFRLLLDCPASNKCILYIYTYGPVRW